MSAVYVSKNKLQDKGFTCMDCTLKHFPAVGREMRALFWDYKLVWGRYMDHMISQ